MVSLFFTRLREGAVLPNKREEDAGYDIYPCFSEDYLYVAPHSTVTVPTGLASAFSPDYYIQLVERGSTGTKGIAQRSGVIDSGYRGEWFVPITNTGSMPLFIVKRHAVNQLLMQYGANQCTIYPSDKAICQAVLLPVPQSTIIEITKEELLSMNSLRMEGNLGSSQK